MKIIKKIFSPTFLTISIFLLIYTIYRSEIYYAGNNRDYYFIYYLISSILITISIFSFYISDKIKSYLVIIFISIIFVFYSFELYFTFKNKNQRSELIQKINIYQKIYKKDYDTRTVFQIYNDLKKENQNIVVSLTPFFYKSEKTNLYAFSGISNSETIFCNENGYYSIYQSDRYGFNNPDKEWDKEKIEYFLVGDSFAHGACVNRPNDIASVLRNISKKNVLNLGYRAMGPLLQFAILREYLKFNTKNIVWIFTEGNDFSDLNNELNYDILNFYLDDIEFSQNLKLKQNEIDKLGLQLIEKNLKKFKKERNLSFKIIKFIKLFNLRNSFKVQTHNFSKFKQILKMSKELSEKYNSNFYFVYLPSYSRYIDKSYKNNYLTVKEIVKELNIPFIDIDLNVFQKEDNPLKLFPFELAGHFNIVGYKKVAQTIHEFISK